MIRAALIGLGKMGISHLSVINAHPDIEIKAICDTSEYVLGVLEKYGGYQTYTDYRKLLDREELDAVFIATPSMSHAKMVAAALDKGLHVFCEKPFCLDPEDSVELAQTAEAKQLVNQVGYHYRFVGTFHEAKRLIDLNALGKLHHIRAEAYGPVVLKPRGSTWRTAKAEGGGCLWDYACHVIDLANYLVGRPQSLSGATLNRLFSRDVEDEVYAGFLYDNGMTGEIAANWSDESYRKMSMKVTAWGTNGKIVADRQEMQVYIRDATGLPPYLSKGWNIRYTTDLTEEVWFYLRGEEYSAQIDHFAQAVKEKRLQTRSTFRSAADTDLVVSAIARQAGSVRLPIIPGQPGTQAPSSKSNLWDTIRNRGAANPSN